MAFQGVDVRDLYLPGGGPNRLTLRRLYVLILALPFDAPLWAAMRAAAEPDEPTEDDKVTRIRERTEYYRRMAEQAEAPTEEA